MTSQTRPATWIAAYAAATVTFLGMDGVWLTTMGDRLYRPALAHLMAAQPDWAAAAIFYPFYVAGLVYFAVRPVLAEGRRRAAVGRGALLGLLCYATYDLTNQATLRDWPWHVTVIDLAWGAIVSGTASLAGAAAALATSRPAAPARGR